MLDTFQADSPLGGLIRELNRQLDTKKDYRADTRRLSFAVDDPDGKPKLGPLSIDLGEKVVGFPVAEYAHNQIGEHFGVNAKFYDKLRANHPDLFVNLANGLFFRAPSQHLVRTLDGNVRAFLSNAYRPRDNWDLVEQAVLPALEAHGRSVVFESCTLTDTRLYIKTIIPEVERPLTPKVGDTIQAGVIIQNSETGNGALGIFPYTYELACLNGMVHTKLGERRIHVGRRSEIGIEAVEFYSDETIRLDDAAYYSKCRDVIAGMLNETLFDAIVSQIQELRGIPVEHDGGPVAVVEIVGKRHGFSENERGAVMAAFVEGGDLSALGYVRAITNAAQKSDPDRRVELETLAGRMVADPSLVAV